MRTEKQHLGKTGENLAGEYLRQKGYSILARNFRFGHGELDLVALDGECLVFAEVKSYFADPLQPPEFRVSKKQKETIIRTALAFLAQFPEWEEHPVRFDLLVVNFARYPAQIRHYEAAFWQEKPF
jgi:putative endonuclease